jgi:hypothetical protein
MVTWGRAFGAAAKYVGFVIVWYIVGMMVIFAGLLPMMTMGPGATPGLTTIICFIIGMVIIMLGTSAALFKILTELIVEEVKK